ncbi:hypothetical protein GQ54DRAFT_316094 [Martensiomyces pterosporus]|nr:hypothetical protein GQ54DRAFT_316094 [Martensiomyces pterosporus]
MPMPANIRKRSEIYSKNIHNRGHVKKSLDPAREQRLEADAMRKKGLGSKAPVPVSGSKKLVIALLLITLGSALYQICAPLFGSFSWSTKATKPTTTLTPEQQAKAAEAILKAMNEQAAEKYRAKAKSYKPASSSAVEADADSDSDAADDEEPPVIKVEGPLV